MLKQAITYNVKIWFAGKDSNLSLGFNHLVWKRAWILHKPPHGFSRNQVWKWVEILEPSLEKDTGELHI